MINKATAAVVISRLRISNNGELKEIQGLCCSNKYLMLGRLLQDIRPAETPNNARAPLGEGIIKEFLPGVYPVTNARA